MTRPSSLSTCPNVLRRACRLPHMWERVNLGPMLRIRDFLLHTLLLAAATTSGCTCGPAGPESVEEGAGGQGGGGGEEPNPFPCGVDCAAIQTPPCTVGVCNTGQELGPLFTCVVVTSPNGASCDDGTFCT